VSGRPWLSSLVALGMPVAILALGLQQASPSAARQASLGPESVGSIASPHVLGPSDLALVDLVAMATVHWVLCQGGRLDTAGPLVTTARTRAARQLDVDDPGVQRAIQATIEDRLEAASRSGYRAWCGEARARLEQALD
jgi:hypothetical protein